MPVAAAEFSGIALQLQPVLIAQSSAERDALAQARAAIEAGRFRSAQRLLESIVSNAPADEKARFLLARVLSWQDAFEASLEQYEILLDQSPANADYLLGKAQVLHWSGKSSDALDVVERARRLAPDYAQVWRLEIQVLTALGAGGDLERARRLRAEAAARFPGENFEPEISDVPSPGARPNEIELTGSFDDLSDGRDAWRGITLRLSHDFSRRENIYAILRGTDRFNEADQELRVGGYLALSEKWTLNLESSVSPSHEVLPHWSVSGRIQRDLSDGWNVQLGLLHRKYTRVESDTGSLTFERYWSDYRAAYTLSTTRIDGGSPGYTHTVQADYFYDDRSFVGAFGYVGEELESLGRGVLLVRDTHGLGLRGVHWFRPEWALTWLVEQQYIEDAFTRRGAFLGLRHRF